MSLSKHCSVCGRMFHVSERYYDAKMYCSRTCAKRANSIAQKVRDEIARGERAGARIPDAPTIPRLPMRPFWGTHHVVRSGRVEIRQVMAKGVAR